MAVLNKKDRIIECKLVYYGPGRSGKTTNLKYIYAIGRKSALSDMISLNTEGDNTLFFDFLPLGLGRIKGFDVKIQLFTVPGQVNYHSIRKIALKNVDGLVFVADSLKVRREANLISLRELQENLAENDKNIFKVPMVFQYNKRDLDEQGIPMMPMEVMEQDLNSKLRVPSFVGSALKGKGVGEALKKCLALTLKSLQQELK